MKSDFRDFESAKKFVNTLNLKDITEWNEYCKSGNKPDDIPSDPENIYKNKEWKTMKHWLNTKSPGTFPTFDEAVTEARKLAKIHNLTGITDWRLACEGAIIINLPSAPYIQYRKEWKGIGYWLGTGKPQVNPPLRVHRSFKEARDFVRSLGLKNLQEWQDYCKSGNKPDDIPSTPQNVYKKRKKKE